MITKINLKNFKCFHELTTFDFSKINLLTGINGRGKSSLLQAILLLSQSSEIRSTGAIKLKLNGTHIDLGSFNDVKNSETVRGENVEVGIEFHFGLIANLILGEDENDELSAVLINKKVFFENEDYSHYSLFLKNLQHKLDEEVKLSKFEHTINSGVEMELSTFMFQILLSKVHYVSADRLGPVKFVEKVILPEFLNVGPKGEYVINVLAKNNLDLVNDKLYRGNDSKSVIQQTQEWLGYILQGATIDIRGRETESIVLSMLINNKNNSYKYKPSNVGYGYSYVLPLIVAGLIAKEGEILIVENPEAHLHPRAQARIAEFFAIVASCGVQVFIESHSEHILNGLRVSVLRPEIGVNNDDLIIHYFNEDFGSEKLSIDEKGKIKDWPSGFFDQQEIDLGSIFRLSR
ncbi:DUF3696 domain-containing protein [Flavobacterium sp. RNTU_13]|uniref:DUF3696 domain-containing protein n=1 Tax=Flavobacterium sp. RNTU_13 TaxID=3375145 RepID=UPI0039882DA8